MEGFLDSGRWQLFLQSIELQSRAASIISGAQQAFEATVTDMTALLFIWSHFCFPHGLETAAVGVALSACIL